MYNHSFSLSLPFILLRTFSFHSLFILLLPHSRFNTHHHSLITTPSLPLPHHHPLPAIFSPSFILPTLIPTIASPNPVLTSASTFASLKCVTALTIAFPLFLASPLLKIPLPTKTPSHPICIISAASAGVATPPAAKFTTGSLPSSLVSCTKLSGTRMASASAASSLGDMVFRAAMSEETVLQWRTASTTSPVPASPFVRIMAAPSFMRRRASPRLRQPQTKGVRKGDLSTWFVGSAGVRTSDSSM